MTLWTCTTCGTDRQPGEPLEGTLDLRYQVGKCRQCGTKRVFRVDDGHGQARHSDPPTSHQAARKIRTGSAKLALLKAHASHSDGLTDEEAAELAGLSLTSEYATRCSELMRAGLLVDTSDTRLGSAGMQRLVRRITPLGVDEVGATLGVRQESFA